MIKVRAAIFDYGNVLSLAPQPSDYQELGRLTQLDEEPFQLLYWKYRADYDRNVLDGPRYWQRIAKDMGKTFSETEIRDLMSADIALWARTDASMLAWVEALKAYGLRTALLSNMPVSMSAYLRRSGAWMTHFDHYVFSGELGVIKPELAIYRACLEGLGTKAEETLFIDDRLVNVDAARAMGMPSVVFESAQQLALVVEQFGLPVLRGSSGDGRS